MNVRFYILSFAGCQPVYRIYYVIVIFRGEDKHHKNRLKSYIKLCTARIGNNLRFTNSRGETNEGQCLVSTKKKRLGPCRGLNMSNISRTIATDNLARNI